MLPTSPPIEIMDAGLRDNYGLKTSIKFINNFKNWIENNTGGVVIVQIRDKQKYFEVENPNSGSIVYKLASPFTNIYNNILKIHDYNNDNLLSSMSDWYNGKVDVVTFYMDQLKDDEISMSWHLTPKDKIKIYNSLSSEDNIKSIDKLMELLNE